MQSTVAKNDSGIVGRVTAWLVIALGVVIGIPSVAQAQQAMVAATVCEAESSIILSQPVGDSTVTQLPVVLGGTVKQANQIEVYIDDVFDSVIPLSVGQTSFNGSIELPQGTHTIKVVAINICPGPNGSDAAVVTYEPPPTTGGSGEQIDTTTEQPPVSSEEDRLPVLPFVPGEAGRAFEEIGRWLNITATYEAPAMPRLTLARATTIAIGSWLLAFGIATTVVQWLGSALPLFGNMPATKRARLIGWIIRGVGLLMVLGGIFL